MKILLAAAALGAGLGGPALAQPLSMSQWQECDGFSEATKKTDGITLDNYSFVGLTTQAPPPLRQNPPASPDAIAACDAVLARPELAEAYWQRRANLLKSRAIHRLSAGDAAGALADLDRAEAAVRSPDDPYYQRGLKLGIELARAYAYLLAGDKPAARALAQKAGDQRPYLRSPTLASALIMARASDRKDVDDALHARGRLDPSDIDLLFLTEMQDGRFADAIALYPQLSPPKTFDSQRWPFQIVEQDLKNRAVGEVYWAARTGMYAIAMDGLGRTAEARAAMDGGRARLASAAATTPPFMANGYPVKSKYLPELAALLNQEMAIQGGTALDKAEAAFGKVAKTSTSPRPFDRPEEELRVILNQLPDSDVAGLIPAYKPAKGTFWGPAEDDVEGYRERTDSKSGLTTVRMRLRLGSAAVGEEMALLRAAELAAAAGRDGIVIIERRDFHHTFATTYNNIPGAAVPTGYSTELDVAFVDRSNLPEPYRQAAWRVLDANDVRRTLTPLYPPPVPKTR
ncbi:hypothetical protein ASE17_05940 [Phenylobacterium sp. Root77]|uniref:hypothetical protein n=1 Tax=unclassified Phenylobacterium TaxID=2640670 RepID=UPI0006FAFE20|nr:MULTISPECIES: hypothetical protein [unclassified Phenylobacterium]KQW66412.1 hypothetical protein ASC73_18685 [Phenylobacterium sp. Root1277]KQW88918.1 hypothetical protein ASC79_19590 [Phenylobacterium sp. Root1290]KRC42227.1 hypothetical protein ASE17_05940 [Phenylobacterium sp. Root77]